VTPVSPPGGPRRPAASPAITAGTIISMLEARAAERAAAGWTTRLQAGPGQAPSLCV
jgi:hypothetical protein